VKGKAQALDRAAQSAHEVNALIEAERITRVIPCERGQPSAASSTVWVRTLSKAIGEWVPNTFGRDTIGTRPIDG
jgi:hypothetical protein